MKRFRLFRHKYGMVALLLWLLVFAVPFALVFSEVIWLVDYKGQWFAWTMWGLWCAASLWTCCVVPWLDADKHLEGDIIRNGRRVVRSCIGSTIIGTLLASLPGLFVVGYLSVIYFQAWAEGHSIEKLYWGSDVILVFISATISFTIIVTLLICLKPLINQLRRSYAMAQRCFACGYNLQGVESDHCPECGRPRDVVESNANA